jgi:c-di-GMP-binding flagellar brake protein YcgR
MDIPCGSRILVEFPPAGDRLMGEVAGGLKDRYLIVALPSAERVKQRCRQGGRLSFRLMLQGAVTVFQADIIQYVDQPFSLLFTEHPRRMEGRRMRCSRRVNCSFPARLHAGGRDYRGVIVDISSGGCQFAFEADSLRAAEGLEPGLIAQGEFRLLDMQDVYPFAGKVASVTTEGGAVQAGLRFDEEQGGLDERVRAYVQEVCRLLKA